MSSVFARSESDEAIQFISARWIASLCSQRQFNTKLKENRFSSQTKSKQRIADHGEVFTAEREVNAMLDLVKNETGRIESRFLEPACGDGNFLAEILRRKLAVVKSRYGKNVYEYERYAVIAVTSIYGVELLPDNASECRKRLFEIFDKEYAANCKKESNAETRQSVRYILKRNILCGNALTMNDACGDPLVFSEWAAVNSCRLKRRDFVFEEMIELKETDLFSSKKSHVNDAGRTVFIAQPVREFPPVHYRKVQELE